MFPSKTWSRCAIYWPEERAGKMELALLGDGIQTYTHHIGGTVR
jgi:hypothetical protein